MCVPSQGALAPASAHMMSRRDEAASCHGGPRCGTTSRMTQLENAALNQKLLDAGEALEWATNRIKRLEEINAALRGELSAIREAEKSAPPSSQRLLFDVCEGAQNLRGECP